MSSLLHFCRVIAHNCPTMLPQFENHVSCFQNYLEVSETDTNYDWRKPLCFYPIRN